MKNIDARTKLVGLLGYPLGHSLSPIMQNTAFKRMGLNFLYIPLETEGKDLSYVIDGIKRMNFSGFNITIPYKIRMMEYMDELDDLARAIGAINTVVISKGRMKGYNTDGYGFVRSFEEGTGLSVRGRRIFLIGSGGAARAIAITLAARGVGRIYICNRTEKRAIELSLSINQHISQCSLGIPMDRNEIKKVLKDVDVVINTTSVGMYPQNQDTPLDIGLVPADATVCDIIYNPPETMLLKGAIEKGCRTLNGLAMLVYQGAEAFKLWTGVEAPVKDMFMVLKKQFNCCG